MPLVQADARALPFADATFDLACSAFGAVPFVADSAGVMREVARVLRPGGRWVFSVTHPMRWAFPDDPGPDGLHRAPVLLRPHAVRGAGRRRHGPATSSTTARSATGSASSSPPGSRWTTWSSRSGPTAHEHVWGGWSPLRGHLLPGTAIFAARRLG